MDSRVEVYPGMDDLSISKHGPLISLLWKNYLIYHYDSYARHLEWRDVIHHEPPVDGITACTLFSAIQYEHPWRFEVHQVHPGYMVEDQMYLEGAPWVLV